MRYKSIILFILLLAPSSTWAESIVAAVLPSSRSVQVGTPATVFATIINAGPGIAIGCGISPITSIPATFTYQATEPTTNEGTGSPNTPIDIGPGAAQTFVLAFTPNAPIASTDVQISFDCINTELAPVYSGINSLLVSAEPTPIPDVVALAATLGNDGIVAIPGFTGTSAFAVAVSNVGVSGSIDVSADTGATAVPVSLSLCETNSTTGACAAPPASTLTTTIPAGGTRTFAVFVNATTLPIPLSPALNRIYVRFRNAGVTRGATSVAVHGPAELPPLSADPAARLRGAELWDGANFSNPLDDVWTHIAKLPTWGSNVVRLSVAPHVPNGPPILPGRPLSERLLKYLESFTTVIDWILEHKIHLVLRFTQRSSGGNIWPDDGRALWTDASAQDELVQAWSELAKHFKGRRGIVFDLMNEPRGFSSAEDAMVTKTWNALYPRLIDAIRAEDPERWIMVETPFGGDEDFHFDNLAVSSAPKLLYSFHFYDPHFFTLQGTNPFYPSTPPVVYPGLARDQPSEPERFWDKSVLEARLQPAIKFRTKHNVRVVVGELGSFVHGPDDSNRRWTSDVIDLLEAHGFDWIYFMFPPRGWSFEGTSFESVVTSRFSLNLR